MDGGNDIYGGGTGREKEIPSRLFGAMFFSSNCWTYTENDDDEEEVPRILQLFPLMDYHPKGGR